MIYFYTYSYSVNIFLYFGCIFVIVDKISDLIIFKVVVMDTSFNKNSRNGIFL